MNRTHCKKVFHGLIIAAALVSNAPSGFAQKKNVKNKNTAAIATDSVFNALKWRNIGPFRAGRSLAVAGHGSQPLTYYFGATGGGVWKTIDGGNEWFPISDSVFKSSSVGAITVAPSDANVIYVGMGEADMRSNISFGDGVYKSVNGGKSWA
ncbi:MAG: WD40/YVTN/BNR-like repeat-containing protein, partial [Flavobacterium sp.]